MSACVYLASTSTSATLKWDTEDYGNPELHEFNFKNWYAPRRLHIIFCAGDKRTAKKLEWMERLFPLITLWQRTQESELFAWDIACFPIILTWREIENSPISNYVLKIWKLFLNFLLGVSRIVDYLWARAQDFSQSYPYVRWRIAIYAEYSGVRERESYIIIDDILVVLVASLTLRHLAISYYTLISHRSCHSSAVLNNRVTTGRSSSKRTQLFENARLTFVAQNNNRLYLFSRARLSREAPAASGTTRIISPPLSRGDGGRWYIAGVYFTFSHV